VRRDLQLLAWGAFAGNVSTILVWHQASWVQVIAAVLLCTGIYLTVRIIHRKGKT
jgi:hypothetical protein